MVKVKLGETLPHATENKRSRSLYQGHGAAGNQDFQCPAHPQREKKKPHYLSVHLFYKLMNSGGAARQQRPRCPSPEVGRGAQLRGQQRGLGHFFHRGSQTPGPILSQRITNEDPGDKRQVRHIEPLHWGKSTCSIFAGGGGQQRRSRSGLAFHKRGSTKQA